VFKGLKVT